MSLPGFTAEAALTGRAGRHPRRDPARTNSDTASVVPAQPSPFHCDFECSEYCDRSCEGSFDPRCHSRCYRRCYDDCLAPPVTPAAYACGCV